jgi:N-acetylglucosaminyldiphosphoundecaprenol N-acetyl-beta-D-mannosaminyltransferase
VTSVSSEFPIVSVGNVPFRIADMESATQWLLASAVPRREGINVRLANAYNVALASRNHGYRELLVSTGLNFPDGAPVVWFMRYQRIEPKPCRIRGPSLFVHALREGQNYGTRHFFLGSTPETLGLLQERVRASAPAAVIAGAYSPPFSPLDQEYVADCAEKICASGADLVWIGLGTPKQDELGAALAAKIDRTCVNVGAAFDFFAGTVREAPLWVQNSGFEWLFRLVSEPRRLWRRYLIGNLLFLVAAVSSLRQPIKPEGGGA